MAACAPGKAAIEEFCFVLCKTIHSQPVLKDISNLGSITSFAVNEILTGRSWEVVSTAIHSLVSCIS